CTVTGKTRLTDHAGIDFQRGNRVAFGLLGKAGDVAAVIHLYDSEITGLLFVHQFAADGYLGVIRDVLAEYFFVILTVKGVATEDKDVRGWLVCDVFDRAAHGIGRTLEPGFSFRGLLSRKHFHPAAGEVVKLVGVGDMAIQRRAVKLG